MSEQNRTCWTCRWWRHESEVHNNAGEVVEGVGLCHRFPAHVRTADTHDCGEWAASDPATVDEAARAMALAVLQGDTTAARALADRVQELAQEGGS